ncbi:hypothetical protein AB0D49_33460 [Streptomyces sp. NPDC048290]
MAGHMYGDPDPSRYVELTVADVCPSPVFFGPGYAELVGGAPKSPE